MVRAAQHLHALGPRAIAEFLAEPAPPPLQCRIDRSHRAPAEGFASPPEAASWPAPDLRPATAERSHARGTEAERRAATFRLDREQTIPPQLAATDTGPALARALGLLFDTAEPIGPTTFRLSRHGLPGNVELNTASLEWRCTSGAAEGHGLVELGAWARCRDLLGTAAMLYAVRLAYERRPRA